MILTPHAIIGTAFARVVTINPVVGFGIGFLSHFLADMVPHWQYEIHESIYPNISKDITYNWDFIKGASKIVLDILVGVALSLWLFYDDNPYLIIASAIGGVFPDFLLFLYGKIKIKPLILYHKYKINIHAEELHNVFTQGILTQSLVLIGVVLISYYLSPL